MKRDMDLIRKMLIQLEETNKAEEIEGYDEETVAYHQRLLVEAGLARGLIEETMSDYFVHLWGLTWNGHEFLSVARDESTWHSAMRQIATKLGSASFALLQALLIEMAKSKMT